MSQRQDKPRLSFLWQGVPAQECQANFPNGMVCRWNLRLKAEPGYTLPSSNYCIPIRAGPEAAPVAQMGAIFSVRPPPAGGAGALWRGAFPVGSSGHGCQGGFHHPQGDGAFGEVGVRLWSWEKSP